MSFWQGYLIAQARCLVSDDVIERVLGAGQVLGEELPLLCPSFPARENDPETPIFVVCPVCKSATVKQTQQNLSRMRGRPRAYYLISLAMIAEFLG